MSSTVEPAAPAKDVAAPVREWADLPGPPGLPLLGNALQLKPGSAHATVEAWARRYGPVFRFSIAKRRLMGIADHAVMGAVLRDRPDGFRRTTRLSMVGAELGLAGGVFSAEGDAWRRQRRMVMSGFDPRHLRAYFPSLVKVAGRLDGRWRRAAQASASIPLQADLMRYTVDAISGLAFGADTNTLESDDDVIQRHLDKIFPALFKRTLSPVMWWRWWKTAADRELENSVKLVNEAIDGFIATARERLPADPARRAEPKNLLEAMIVAADDEGSGITDAEVSGNVMTMLLAGEDTTANTLAWMIDLLRRHPDSLARARDEVDRELGARAGWTLERFARLEWLDACTNETMRLKPVAPMIMAQAARETVVAGVRVPAEGIVWGVMRSDSVDERFFPQADRFMPERWLEAHGEKSASSVNRIAMPFGAGPRVCPGRQLALLEIKIAMAVLLGGFDIVEVTTADGRTPEERMTLTMAPEPLAMRLAPRRATSAA